MPDSHTIDPALLAELESLREQNAELERAWRSMKVTNVMRERVLADVRTATTVFPAPAAPSSSPELEQALQAALDDANALRAQLHAATVVQEITRVMSSSLQVADVLRTILAGVQEALDRERVVFFKAAEEGGLKAELWSDFDGAEERCADCTLPTASPMLARLLQEEPVISSGPDELAETDREFARRLDSASFAMIPLMSRDISKGWGERVFQGAIWVDNPEPDRPIPAADVAILSAFANQAAIAIDNARAHTELEQKDRRLAEEKSRIESILETMTEGLLALDLEGQVTYANRAAQALTGYGREELLGRDPAFLLAGGMVLPWADPPPSPNQEDQLLARSGGQVPVYKNAVVMRDADGRPTGGVIVFHDITSLKELERVKADFTSMIVHDLRSPVGSIKCFTEILASPDMPVSDEERAEMYQMMQGASEQVLTLINDFLDVSKIEAGKLEVSPEAQDLVAPIRTALALTRVLAEQKKIQVALEAAPGLPKAMVDGERIKQVINNLVSNAIKFTPEGGRVTVSIRPHAEGLAVSVADTGCGMRADEIPKLFEKYKQVSSAKKTKAKGTGLGLVICKTIVEAHGGRIWVESALDRGTTFTFVLPAAREA